MLTVRTFLTSKKGEELEDCQDSIHPFPAPPPDTGSRVFAVSDGTTTSFFSRAWSAILTRHFADNPEQAFTDWDGWLRNAQAEWQSEIGKVVETGKASFFVVNGFRAHKPAAATFVGLALGESTGDGTSWRALVLGDSCLFFLRANSELRVMNLTISTAFSSVVETAESWPPDAPHRPTQHGSSPNGDDPPIMEHDTVLLASDAFSKWMLSRHERGLPVWGSVLGLKNDSEFSDLISKARLEAENPLENDDVALAVLKFGDPHPVYQEQHFEPNPPPQPVPPVANPPRPDAPSPAPTQELPPTVLPPTAALGHPSAPSYPAPRGTLLKPRRRFRRFVLLFALSTLSLAGVFWLGMSRNRALDQAGVYQNELRRLSDQLTNLGDEKAEAMGRAERYRTDLQAERRERVATERQAQQDAKIRRESKDDLLRRYEMEQKADRRKIAELQEQIAALKEQLAMPLQTPTPGDMPSPAPN